VKRNGRPETSDGALLPEDRAEFGSRRRQLSLLARAMPTDAASVVPVSMAKLLDIQILRPAAEN
jgi:hypothetical protein